jgi:serine/threonine-protein phosphatase 2A regulatory subunit B'
VSYTQVALTKSTRTIHSMVYNAMKLFMEVNPQLFDECSHEYTEHQNNAEAVKANRKAKWDQLAQLAESMKQNGHAPAVRPPASGHNSKPGSRVTSPLRSDDGDPLSQESQQRMERLRLQDDRDRRPKDYERHSSNSVR